MSTDDRPSIACVSGRRVVDVLAGMDVRTVLLGDPTPLDLACLADVPLDVDLGDWKTTEVVLGALHQVRPLTAVFSVFDAHLPLASYLAERLDVRGLSLAAALACDDKARMRLALEGAGITGPRYLAVDDPADASSAARRLGFPVVVKKAVGARGRGSLVCQDDADVASAVTAFGGGPVLVESYVDGPEYAIQTITVDGVTEVVNVLAQHVGSGPRQPELGYDYPSGLGEVGGLAVGKFAASALRALGFDNGVAHVQVRVSADGPVLINIAARPPGGQLCALTERVSGVDMTRAAVDVALGLPVLRREPTASRALYRCVAFGQAGVVDYDVGALDSPGVFLDVEPGDPVHPADDPRGGSYGRIVVYGDETPQLLRDYHSILDSLRPRVRPSRMW
ncbi:acetyl-CoA carboxylase biotin carboxylase subunit family protein [Umezawaea sp. NPDC059074]|uniref:ATP-grasp domain-containing protein n=1 Tax=Umezawaea sp. NPDC059074 TaxID=3346716 RepID=UPI00368B6F58